MVKFIKKKVIYDEKPQDEVTRYLNRWLADERLILDTAKSKEAAERMDVHRKNCWILIQTAYSNHNGGRRDATSFRFHSSITRTARVMRSFVSFAGENLVAVDIKNSQPYFLSLVIKRGVETPITSKKAFLLSNNNDISDRSIKTRIERSEKQISIKEVISNENISLKDIKNTKIDVPCVIPFTYVPVNCKNESTRTEFQIAQRQHEDPFICTSELQHDEDPFICTSEDEHAEKPFICTSEIVLVEEAFICTSEYEHAEKPFICTSELPHAEDMSTDTCGSPLSDPLTCTAVDSTEKGLCPDVCTGERWLNVAENIVLYIELNHAGVFYEGLANLWNTDRDTAKAEFMPILFGKNRWKSENERIFMTRFPHVYKMIRTLKINGHNKLAIKLQRMESKMVIDHACVFLMNHHP